MPSVDGRIAMVSGAARGIGRTEAQRQAEACDPSGARTLGMGVRSAPLQELTDDDWRSVLVNAVTPAVIETDILKQVSDEHRQYMLKRIPMGRAGQPHEVAALVAWLCSDECSFSTGAVFDLSGGRATY